MKWSQEKISSYYMKAKDELYEKNRVFIKENNISIFEHTKYRQNDDVIEFTSDNEKSIICSFIPVGTLTKATGSWLWAWNNRIYSRRISEPYSTIRRFGMKHGIEKLQRYYWEGSQEDAVFMTEVMCKLIDGNGMYIKMNKLVDLYLVLISNYSEKEFYHAPTADAPKARAAEA